MTSTTPAICAIGDSIIALLPLLNPKERASIAGAIMADAGVDADTAAAFAAELPESDLDDLRDFLDE